MQRYRHQLNRVWRLSLTQPRLLMGWGGLISLLLGVRWLSQRSGWSVSLVLTIAGLCVVTAAQLTQVAVAVAGKPTTGSEIWHRVWQRKWAWTLVLLIAVILALPFGLWGLGSRFWARLVLPASLINFVTLHRRPVLMVVGGLYLLLAGIFWLWGPRWWFRRESLTGGSVRQIGGALGIWAGLTVAWLAGSEGLVAVLHVATDRLLLLVAVFIVLLGFCLVTILGLTTVVWAWCGQPRQLLVRLETRGLPGTLALSLVSLVMMGMVTSQTVFAQPAWGPTTLISHRGVDHGRGIQNTVGALRQVTTHHPDYVEMDLHETHDRQWVVLHDENLKTLAGRNVTPHDLTLQQLQRLTLHENGQQARLSSWPAYLRVAEARHQRLMVEIKTTPHDSPGAIRRFAATYGDRLQRDGSVVHSLDYRVVRQLRRLQPHLKVGVILPFNWVNPRSLPADFYSFQRLSASQQFIAAAHQQGAPAYLWTPDTPATMTRMWALGADGQITNELSRLREVTRQSAAATRWAVLQNFVLSYA
ncbi:glycerophosphoryl diester phosphodiesterase [Levilactobacillus paucivorans]|uniref:Glycerophosphoryl diester phosphodiesterase n=1 Tax=Levilactobacillus paucivorans TaxID=616990 RepID=A0A0R2LWD4_9LACO|nr:glycerophosphodiester phosphodiesterase [Levilactobacillus paucivorans]KRO03565.1 glycerophosphoryl diester phosphodiesterase [Levilactobacillus paucivorans]